MNAIKICPRCETPKPLKDFHLHLTRGRQTWCRECQNAAMRAVRASKKIKTPEMW